MSVFSPKATKVSERLAVMCSDGLIDARDCVIDKVGEAVIDIYRLWSEPACSGELVPVVMICTCTDEMCREVDRRGGDVGCFIESMTTYLPFATRDEFRAAWRLMRMIARPFKQKVA